MRSVLSLLTILLALGATSFGQTAAEDSASQVPADSAGYMSEIASRYVVTIGRIKVTDGELFDTLDVVLDSKGAPIGGFDLKVGCDSPYLEIVEVLKGDIPDSCNWEFFQARRVRDLGQEGIPSTLWKTTALAQFLPDSTSVPCFGLGRPASLIRLVVSSLHVDLVPDTTAPIYFFWQLCADNVISSAEGTAMLVSKQVFDYYPVELEGKKDVFPTRFGTPQQCINPSLANGPVRKVEFHNGGVEFKLEVDPEADSATDSL